MECAPHRTVYIDAPYLVRPNGAQCCNQFRRKLYRSGPVVMSLCRDSPNKTTENNIQLAHWAHCEIAGNRSWLRAAASVYPDGGPYSCQWENKNHQMSVWFGSSHSNDRTKHTKAIRDSIWLDPLRAFSLPSWARLIFTNSYMPIIGRAKRK